MELDDQTKQDRSASLTITRCKSITNESEGTYEVEDIMGINDTNEPNLREMQQNRREGEGTGIRREEQRVKGELFEDTIVQVGDGVITEIDGESLIMDKSESAGTMFGRVIGDKDDNEDDIRDEGKISGQNSLSLADRDVHSAISNIEEEVLQKCLSELSVITEMDDWTDSQLIQLEKHMV